MKNIVVTGGCGYIGSVLVKYLLENTDYNISVIDKLYFGADALKDVLSNERLKLYPVDIRKIDDKTEDAIKNANAIVHLAAISNDPSAELNYETSMGVNVQGTINLINLCVKYNTGKFIYASTCSVYGKGDGLLNEQSSVAPLSTYGVSKVKAEQELYTARNVLQDVTVFRFGTAYGYSDRLRTDLVVNTMSKFALLNNEIIVLGGGNQFRPHVHVRDIARAIACVLDKDKTGYEIYNLVNINRKIIDLAYDISGMLIDLTGRRIEVKRVLDDTLDKRDYNVSGDKFKKAFNFEYKFGVNYAVKEIYDAYMNGKINDFNNMMYKNTEWIQHLFRMKSYLDNLVGDIL